MYSACRADREYSNSITSRGAGGSIPVHQSVAGFKCRFDFELANKCVRTEIPVIQGSNLLTGNHRFSPNSDMKTVEQCFNYLENIFNPYSFRVITLGDFHVSDNDSGMGFPQTNSLLYKNYRWHIHIAACYSGHC